MTKDRTIAVLLEEHGRSFSDEVGITLANKPAPLFQLLVFSMLCGAPVRASAAVAGARALFAQGWTTPEKVARATIARRVRVLREAGYARFIERAAASVGGTAKVIVKNYEGDLRKARAEAGEDPAELRRVLKTFPGMGETAVDVFISEAQGVWPELAPFAGARALEAAQTLGLGSTPHAIAAHTDDLPVLVAALTRCALAGDVAAVRAAARA